jgi:hypothetical protein
MSETKPRDRTELKRGPGWLVQPLGETAAIINQIKNTESFRGLLDRDQNAAQLTAHLPREFTFHASLAASRGEPVAGFQGVIENPHWPAGCGQHPQHTRKQHVLVVRDHDGKGAQCDAGLMHRAQTNADIQDIHRSQVGVGTAAIEKLAISERTRADQNVEHLMNLGGFDEAIADDLEQLSFRVDLLVNRHSLTP